jgi:hypothetical protein
MKCNNSMNRRFTQPMRPNSLSIRKFHAANERVQQAPSRAQSFSFLGERGGLKIFFGFGCSHHLVPIMFPMVFIQASDFVPQVLI